MLLELVFLLTAAPAAREDFSLDNGIRVTIVHAPAATREAIFTVLPLGLLGDDVRRAQHSHLLEHALIRSTDPQGLSAPGFTLNGETQATTLRLETIAEAPYWREALTRHGRWLTARVFDPAMLEREKAAAASELDTTVPHGFTHKWATAAWAQIVRHGLKHAAVRGDVASATVADMQTYVAAHVGPSPRVRIVCVGPIAPKDVRETLVAGIGMLPAAQGLAPPPPPDAAPAPSDRSATWDLPARHYIEWYALPDGGPSDRAAAALLATAITQNLMLAGETKILATAEAAPGVGRVLFVSAPLAADASPDAIRAATRKAIDALAKPAAGSPDLATRIRMASAEVGGLPDFAAIRKARAGQPGLDLLEGNMILGLVAVEESTGLSGNDLAAAYGGLKPERLAAIVSASLGEKSRSSLVLEPAAR